MTASPTGNTLKNIATAGRAAILCAVALPCLLVFGWGRAAAPDEATGLVGVMPSVASHPAPRHADERGADGGRMRPEAMSLLGKKLFAPHLEIDLRAEQESKLAAARADLEGDDSNPTNWVWVGRRIAYLGQYLDAIEHYTTALERFPEEPRLYRHRGHRYLSTRQMDLAIGDFEKAAKLIEGKEDVVEPDGLPNARGIPTSTLQSNIFYHLALAHYVKNDFKRAVEAYAKCLQVSKNPDMLVATTYWYHVTLRRLGRVEDAEGLIAAITPDLEIIENTAYFDLIGLFQGRTEPEALLGGTTEALDNATVGYGVGIWHLMNGRDQQARQVFQRTVEGKQWAAFGYLAAEAELARAGD